MCLLDFKDTHTAFWSETLNVNIIVIFFKQIKTKKSQGPKDFCPYFDITGHLGYKQSLCFINYFQGFVIFLSLIFLRESVKKKKNIVE